MNYLENMSENLELLDLVEKNCLSTAALENVSNKTEAVLNLKELQLMLTAPSFFYTSYGIMVNVFDSISKEILNHAEAVKTILVNKYKISASRITAEGQGVGDMFTEPDWNRVSICTIED